jgi:chemotaxis protein MotB
MAKKKCPDCPECLPQWLAAFGDMMSLLVVFFVLLLSMSSMDAKKVSEAIGSLSGAMGVLDGGTQTTVSNQQLQQAVPREKHDESIQSISKIRQAIEDANEMMQRRTDTAAISLEDAQEGLVITLPSALLFKRGSAKITDEDTILFLKRIALIIGQLPNSMNILVNGYTDNQPPMKNSPYKDSWQLSSARALAVVKELVTDGVRADRLGAVGYGEYRPVTTNDTPAGRERNRRVTISFFAADQAKDKKADKSILNKVKRAK